jgi:hypothetical protein
MSRPQQIRALTQRLQQAATAADWRALGGLDRELAASVALWARDGTWSEAEQTLLTVLRELHAQLCQRCGDEVQRLQRQLQEMLATQEGWTAYATYSNNSEWQGALE